ncbi:hypothetical protein BH09MYX1_BH09MYX1_02570 [soil metagenome]
MTKLASAFSWAILVRVKRFLFLLLLCACERPSPLALAPAPVAAPVATADSCRREIPDCAAACGLRETGRLEHIDWFDRRCAAVILGKNPDKAIGTTDVVATNVTPQATSTSTATAPPTGTAITSTRPEVKPPFDPFAAQRHDVADPPECVAARRLVAKGLTRDAQALAALCEAKGGDAGAPLPKGPEGDDPFASRH